MDERLRKKLEEAAEKYARKVVPECISSYEEYFEDTKANFRNVAELGYKEAITQCKEWLKKHSNTEYYSDGASYCDTPFATQEDMLDTFNFDMNKL